VAVLRARLAGQRLTAAAALGEALGWQRYLDLLDRLHAAASHPPLIRGSDIRERTLLAAEVMPKLVGKRWRKIKRKVTAGGRAPSASELHRIRIAAKNLRYASELAQPVIAGPAGKTAKLAEHVQTVLGDYHDASSSIDWLSQAGSTDSAGVGFAAGVLAARQDRGRQKLVKQWHRRWARLAGPAHRRWLT
jgi:CHAD domain-containing protein